MDKKELIPIYAAILDQMNYSMRKYKRIDTWEGAYHLLNEQVSKADKNTLRPLLKEQLTIIAADALCAVTELSSPRFLWVNAFKRLTEVVDAYDYKNLLKKDTSRQVYFEGIKAALEIFRQLQPVDSILKIDFFYAIAAHSVKLLDHMQMEESSPLLRAAV